jgi:hypothetical protein
MTYLEIEAEVPMSRLSTLLAAIAVSIVLCGSCLVIVMITPLGKPLRIDCSIGIVGTSVSITVRGMLAGRTCQTLAMSTSADFFELSDKPTEPVICEYTRDRLHYIVRDTGVLKLYGTAICDQLRNGASEYSLPQPSVLPTNRLLVGITEISTAKTIDSDKRPNQKTAEFTIGSQMYITYTARNVKRGETIDLKLYRNGTKVDLTGNQTVFEKDATYYGYYTYTPSQPGSYKAELYYNGEGLPSQTVAFTVR